MIMNDDDEREADANDKIPIETMKKCMNERVNE